MKESIASNFSKMAESFLGESYVNEIIWSADVETKWNAPEDFFTRSAEKIASGLKSASKDLKQAMSRLNFYVNRSGSNLSADDKKRLNLAKVKLRHLYGED